MSADRISRLHEQASEHYLNGDYTAALASWQEVLALDPGNEEALEGAKMASQFAEEQAPAPPAPPPSPDLERDLDLGLKVFDSLGTKAPPAPVAFDLGDPSQVDAAPVMTPVEEGWEPAPSEDVSFGLAPAPAALVDASGAPTAAAVELRRRVDDLLTQARSKIEVGERDEALAILARVSILDEENAEAVAIRTELETSGKTDLDRIEQAIIEGVSALESDRLDDAERLFGEALSLSPGHREALHYMEQVTSRRAAASAPPPPAVPAEDLLGDADAFGAPSGGTPPPADPAAVPLAAAKPRASRTLPPSMPEVGRPLASRLPLPSLRTLVLVGVVGGVAAAGYWGYATFFDGSSSSAPETTAATAPPPAKPEAPPAKPAGAPAPVAGADRPAAVATAVAKGKRLAESGDFAGAVVAFNEAVTLDPANLDARAALTSAGAQYKAQKADQDALKSIEGAFKEGEYASGLRLAYRLPATIDPGRVERIKSAGWYNMAIIALRGGDTRGATDNCNEALAIDANDAEAAKLKEFAVRYADAPKDRAFLDTVEALPFRPFP